MKWGEEPHAKGLGAMLQTWLTCCFRYKDLRGHLASLSGHMLAVEMVRGQENTDTQACGVFVVVVLERESES